MVIPEYLKNRVFSDSATYNIRLHFPNGERTDVTNNMIVEGSAKLTESLCSQDELKFGLCESPTFECETVGVGNIKGLIFELIYEIIVGEPVTEGRPNYWRSDIQQYVRIVEKASSLFKVAKDKQICNIENRGIWWRSCHKLGVARYRINESQWIVYCI